MLAYKKGISSKCVSERHVYASQRKLTAGEAAKLLTKKVGAKVLAREVKELYITHYGIEPEWHHSGFYRGANGNAMGRTFFLSEDEVRTLADNYVAIVRKHADDVFRKEAELHRQVEATVMGFYWTWNYDYGGPYRKKRYFKVLHAYEGNELCRPRNFTPCSADVLERVKVADGRKYFGWDEPKVEEFD